MPVFDPGVPWLRGTATLTNGSTTVETDGVITLNEILEGDRLYVFDNGSRLGPFEIVGGEEAVIELREAFEGATGSYSIAIDRNPITRTGAKTLRDVADILGRIGNFGELSERDQISSDLIPIGPERDAIKDALDVTRRAANLADLTNLKEARANLGTFPSAADVKSRNIPAVLESIRTFGRNAPGDGPPLDLVRGAEVPGAVQSADGQWWEDVGYNTITVRIPSQFPTLQAAIDHYSRLPMRQGATINLLIESGHQPSSGISVSNGNYGHFLISSVDAEVLVANDYTGRFIEADYAAAPILNCLVDARNRGGSGYWCGNSSQGQVNPGCGVMNVEGRAGLYANSGSLIAAGGSVFTGAASRGAWATRGGIISCDGADFSGARSDPDDHDEAVIYVSRTGMIDATHIIAHDATTRRIFGAKRTGLINAHGCDVSGSTLMAVESRRAGVILVNDGVFADIGGQGLVADGPGAVVEATGVSLSGAAGNTKAAVQGIRGGRVKVGGNVSGFRDGILSQFLAVVVAGGSVLDGMANTGAYAADGGEINLRSSSVKNSGNVDLAVDRGGRIYAHDTSTTQSEGTPDIRDTNIGVFNELASGRGIIYTGSPSPSAIVASAGNDEEGYWQRGDGWTECWSTITFDSDSTSAQNFAMPLSFRSVSGVQASFTSSASSASATAALTNTNISVTTASRWTVRRVGGSGDGLMTLRLFACGYVA